MLCQDSLRCSQTLIPNPEPYEPVSRRQATATWRGSVPRRAVMSTSLVPCGIRSLRTGTAVECAGRSWTARPAKTPRANALAVAEGAVLVLHSRALVEAGGVREPVHRRSRVLVVEVGRDHRIVV